MATSTSGRSRNARNESAELGAIEACAAIAMQRGAFAKIAAEGDGDHDDVRGEPVKLRFAAEHDGFNLHAGVRIAAGDDAGRERLMRYGARPAIALDRLRRMPDGRFAYRVKYSRTGAAKHRILTPIEVLARILAILPPPRFPLLRYHGVLAPSLRWRRDVTPKPPEAGGHREPRSERPRTDASAPERGGPKAPTAGSRPTATAVAARDGPECGHPLANAALAAGGRAEAHAQRAGGAPL